ncbi:MAG: proline dehydrogenase family protein [Ignavibacteriaceae bacterium]
MGLGRNTLLWASRNNCLKNRVPKMKFMQRAVKRFMPGETAEKAILATKELLKNNIPTTLTHLGENIANLEEAEINTQHYLDLLDKINKEKFDIEISLKLTQIGLDLSIEKTLEFFATIVEKAKALNNNVFIDIEDSSYVDKTINFYKKTKEQYNNVGLCLQAYLYRTMDDLRNMIKINPFIRLVKGAYKEPATIAFPKMSQVNKNFISLSKYLLEQINEKEIRVAFGTHDLLIQEQVKREAKRIGLQKEKLEFQMLYGIKTSEQFKLALDGYKIRTLISYGEQWYPWYMRRLAERPANVGFVLKNIFSK